MPLTNSPQEPGLNPGQDLLDKIALEVCRRATFRKFPSATEDQAAFRFGQHRPIWLGDGQAILRAIEAAGYVVVPVEPTREMERAGDDVIGCSDGVASEYVWEAMIGARPR